jgi:hypothetical protein
MYRYIHMKVDMDWILNIDMVMDMDIDMGMDMI